MTNRSVTESHESDVGMDCFLSLLDNILCSVCESKD